MSNEDIRSDAASQGTEQQLSDEEIRQQLTAELDELTQRIQALELGRLESQLTTDTLLRRLTQLFFGRV